MLLALLYLLSVLYFYFRGLELFMLAVLFFMTLSNKNTPYSVKEEIYQQHFPVPNICEKNPQYTEFHKRDTFRSNTTDYHQHNNTEKF